MGRTPILDTSEPGTRSGCGNTRPQNVLRGRVPGDELSGHVGVDPERQNRRHRANRKPFGVAEARPLGERVQMPGAERPEPALGLSRL
jgi:hypothetical protein